MEAEKTKEITDHGELAVGAAQVSVGAVAGHAQHHIQAAAVAASSASGHRNTSNQRIHRTGCCSCYLLLRCICTRNQGSKRQEGQLADDDGGQRRGRQRQEDGARRSSENSEAAREKGRRGLLARWQVAEGAQICAWSTPG